MLRRSDPSLRFTLAPADSLGRLLRQYVPTPLPHALPRKQTTPFQLFQDILRCDLLPLQDCGCLERRHSTPVYQRGQQQQILQ